MHALRIALIAVLASLVASMSFAGERPQRFSIEVEKADWGGAAAQDIERVLSSVASVLLRDLPQRAPTRVYVVANSKGPRVLFEKMPGDVYVVWLSVKGTRWDQFAYQFSHELCHILTEFEHRAAGHNDRPRAHQWFEEALCEAVALVALQRVGILWEKSPPYPHWRSYAAAFTAYAETLLNQPHRQLHDTIDYAGWYKQNNAALDSDPYLRAHNEVLATRLFRLIDSTPAGLSSIAFVNRASSPNTDFVGYLQAWYDCCPNELRSFVRQVIALFQGRAAEPISARLT